MANESIKIIDVEIGKNAGLIILMFTFEHKIISLEILRQVHKFIVKNLVRYLFKPCKRFCPDMVFNRIIHIYQYDDDDTPDIGSLTHIPYPERQ